MDHTLSIPNQISTLDLVEQINIFRANEGKSNLTHSDFLKVVRLEFDDEINAGNVSLVKYKDKKGEDRPMYILNQNHVDRLMFRIKNKSRIKIGLQEEASLKTIEQILGVSLIRQFKVGRYRVDGYDPKGNVVYEIDEPHHKMQVEKDNKREEYIKSILNCEFIRIKL